MRRLFFIAWLLLLYNFGFSHEHWIDLENFSPKVGEKIKVFACSGHSFPKSSEILSEKVFNGFVVITPENKEKVYLTRPHEESKTRIAEIPFEEEGAYVILFYLKKPPLESPVYIAKALVSVGEKIRKSQYTLKNELEIIPEKEISQPNLPDELPIRVFYDKKPVSLTMSVSVDGEKNFFLRTNKEGLASLKIKSSGRYLITTNYKGIGSSLTFFIPEKR